MLNKKKFRASKQLNSRWLIAESMPTIVEKGAVSKISGLGTWHLPYGACEVKKGTARSNAEFDAQRFRKGL